MTKLSPNLKGRWSCNREKVMRVSSEVLEVPCSVGLKAALRLSRSLCCYLVKVPDVLLFGSFGNLNLS